MSLFHKQVTRYYLNGKQVLKSTPGAIKKTEKSKLWTARYTDVNGSEQEISLYRDKTASQQKLAELIRNVSLAETGLVSNFDEAAKRPLAEHIDDWLASLRDRNRSKLHVSKLGGYVRKTMLACGWKRLKEISLSDAEKYLAELRETVLDAKGNKILGLSVAASNDHIAALKNFGNWLVNVRPKRWPHNPFSGMKKLNSASDVRLDRRPANPEELQKLLTATANGKPFRGLTGEDRVMLYLVATETGFRASELASLTFASLDLAADIPTIPVEAGDSKRGRRDVQPIRRELADRLKKFLNAKLRASETVRLYGQNTNKLWPGTWNQKAAPMLRIDLESAGIPFEDKNGRRLDFHSLRGTFATNLAKAGVSPKAAQELMRHSDINLTMKVYTNLRLSDVASDLNKLPSLQTEKPKTLRATGTAGHRANDSQASTTEPPVSVARLVAHSSDDSWETMSLNEETQSDQISGAVSSFIKEKVPDLQGLDESCGRVMTIKKQEPPDRVELSTYALRKHRSAN